MGINKQFSKTLCDKFDPHGKRVAIEIMRDVFEAELVTENTTEGKGYELGVWDQLFILPSGEEWKVEPEIKVNEKGYYADHWIEKNGYPFRWDTVDIPYRKAKCDAHVHLVISDDETYAFMVERAVMNQAIEDAGGPKWKITKYEPQGGYYFAVDPTEGIWLKKGDIWERMNDANGTPAE